jgi:hypothetical protein
MRNYCLAVCAFACMTLISMGQQPPVKMPTEFGKSAATPEEAMFQAKIKAEWEAIKNKDKKAYGDLLADDYEGVEVDGRGERNRIQAMNELAEGNVDRYTLWGFKMMPLGTDANFVIYEVTMQFPPKAVVHFSRVYISELWVKRGAEWKILHYQETHVK